MGLRFSREQGALLLLPVFNPRKRTPGNKNNTIPPAFPSLAVCSVNKCRPCVLRHVGLCVLVHHSASARLMIGQISLSLTFTREGKSEIRAAVVIQLTNSPSENTHTAHPSVNPPTATGPTLKLPTVNIDLFNAKYINVELLVGSLYSRTDIGSRSVCALLPHART